MKTSAEIEELFGDYHAFTDALDKLHECGVPTHVVVVDEFGTVIKLDSKAAQCAYRGAISEIKVMQDLLRSAALESVRQDR